MSAPRNPDRFHGRMHSSRRQCQHPTCQRAGEFRAPNPYGRPPGPNGPGDYLWFCLDHVREFNAGYDWFEGMSAEEIIAAQSPIAGWRTETRAFRPDAGVDGVPRWADYADPLDAIAARARGIRNRAEGRAREAAAHVGRGQDDGPGVEADGIDLGAGKGVLPAFLAGAAHDDSPCEEVDEPQVDEPRKDEADP